MIIFANNAQTTLANPINAAATSINLAAGTGSEFPTVTTGNYFLLTFQDAATGLVNEIVQVTARSGDTCTIVRAQEGTTAKSWLAADVVANLLTAGTLQALGTELQLGFTPVQQGGGTEQGANKVYLGWDSGGTGRLRYQIDTSDEADLANYADVTAEASTRAAADAAEATARAAADTSEATTRAAADVAEATARNNAIVAEASARSAADSAETASRISNDNSEITNRVAADAATLASAESFTEAWAYQKAAFYFTSSPTAIGIPTPGGTPYIISGSVTVPQGGAETDFYLSTAFPNACLDVLISYQASVPPNDGNIGADSVPGSTTQFKATNTASGSSSNGCTYVAIGW